MRNLLKPIPVLLAFTASAVLADGQSDINDAIDQVKVDAINSVAGSAETATKGTLQQYFPTVEVEFSYDEVSELGASVLILAPLFDQSDVKNTFFTQDSIFVRNGRTTINLGLGYRRLAMDNTLLLGVNGFYDHEFPYNHGRTSVGLEARTSMWQVNANQYRATTDWVTGLNGNSERALNGYDVEAAIPVPYMNWMTLSLKQFSWGRDLETLAYGKETTLDAQIPAFPGLGISLAQTNFSGNELDDKNTVKISYTFSDSASRQQSEWISSSAFTLESMETKRFDKVKRENEIVKQISDGVTYQFVIKGI